MLRVRNLATLKYEAAHCTAALKVKEVWIRKERFEKIFQNCEIFFFDRSAALETMMWTILRVLNTPRLFWIYGRSKGSAPNLEHFGMGEAFVPNFAEGWGQYVVSWVRFLAELSLYTSPFLIYYFGRPLAWDSMRQNARTTADIVMGATAVYVIGLLFRAYGRATNPIYVEFVNTLRKAQSNFSSEAKEALSLYDFEFWAWPTEFAMSNVNNRIYLTPSDLNNGILCLPHKVIGWLMINTFGLKLIYPGSTKWLFQALVGPALAEHRAQLVVKRGGQRVKLGTRDGNDIDAMFFDKRTSQGETGKFLVICCEGNAGFYEMGMLTTPLEAGYSVIGWNHPGFWGSTGSPLPSQDANAVDAVMQYAITKLEFPVDRIVVYGWSIGGFPASWLAMNYPQIHAAILDATFDHLTPLAVPRMPAFLENVVKVSIDSFVNLDVGSQMIQYQGPIRLIKRTKDEMISTDEKNFMETNRGNDLLVMLLKHRYPSIVEDESLAALLAFLASDSKAQEATLNRLGVSEDELTRLIASHINKFGSSYPMKLGEDFTRNVRTKMLLFLASKYKTEFDATHNMPLPAELFQLPWLPSAEKS